MNISDKELEQAKNLINSFCIGEFGNATDFTKLSSVNIAYTTITDAEIPIQVTLDLERYYLMRTLDGHVIGKEEYDTFQDFYENCLEGLNFDDLVYVTDEQLQAFYGSLTYSLDNLAYSSDGSTVDFDVVRDYAPNIHGKFTIYNDQSKGPKMKFKFYLYPGLLFQRMPTAVKKRSNISMHTIRTLKIPLSISLKADIWSISCSAQKIKQALLKPEASSKRRITA